VNAGGRLYVSYECKKSLNVRLRNWAADGVHYP